MTLAGVLGSCGAGGAGAQLQDEGGFLAANLGERLREVLAAVGVAVARVFEEDEQAFFDELEARERVGVEVPGGF